MTYAETLAATTTGAYSDYSFAIQLDAALFMEAAGGGTACIDPANNTSVFCGRISVRSTGIFGDTDYSGIDRIWFVSNDSDGSDIGVIRHGYFLSTMQINWEAAIYLAESDEFSSSGRFSEYAASWLLYRNTPNTIPVPAAFWLFGGILLALFWVNQSREHL